MNIKKLSFEKLHALSSSKGITRLQLEYHQALERAWFEAGVYEDRPVLFMVSAAERRFPEIVAKHKPQIDFLNGPEVKAQLRYKADHTTIPYYPGVLYAARSCEFYNREQELDAYGLALVCKYFLDISRVHGRISRRTPGSFIVLAGTTFGGLSILRHRSGLPISMLRSFCEGNAIDFDSIFWWVKLASVKVSHSSKINPIRRCLNSPDVTEHANDLLH